MKILTKLTFCFVFLSVGISCSNEIDLTSEWKDVPIVYGILSRTDSVHYVRVEKAFLDDTKSALEIAKIPDSIYYPNATVQLQKINTSEDPIIFERVDAALENIPRDEGIFATSPNFIYKLKLPAGESFEAEAEYELLIDRGENFPLVTSQTTIIPDIRITAPKIPESSIPLNWGEYNWELKIRWRTKIPTAFFDVVLFINLYEFETGNMSDGNPVTLEWVVKRNQLASSANNNGDISMSMGVPAENFYQFLAAKLEPQNGVFRKFESIDLMVRSGGPEFLEYIQLRQANSGITSSQVIPQYSNLSIGLGIFSSRNKILYEGYEVTEETIDSLIDSDWTRDLNFIR